MERLGAALGEPGVVGAWYGADGVLEEAEVGGEGGVVGGEDEGAHDDVRMAVYVFRDAVEDDVGAEEERGRIEGRKEGVVDENKRVRRMRVCKRSYSGDVDDTEGGIRGGLYPYELKIKSVS